MDSWRYPVAELRPRRLGKLWAGVQATRKGKRYVIEGGKSDVIFAVKADAYIRELKPDEKVVTEEGEELEPLGTYYRTVETIDPYHMILDIWDV